MAYVPPQFDVTGRAYTVDPAPVQSILSQGANIQRDTIKNLAGVVQTGLDVTGGIMARRQLADLKTQLSQIDPKSEDYAIARGNLLANNSMAFTDPRTRTVADGILSGYDKARADEVAKQKAVLQSDMYLDRLGLTSQNQEDRLRLTDQLQRSRMQLQNDLISGRPSRTAGKVSQLSAMYGIAPRGVPVADPVTTDVPPADYGLDPTTYGNDLGTTAAPATDNSLVPPANLFPEGLLPPPDGSDSLPASAPARSSAPAAAPSSVPASEGNAPAFAPEYAIPPDELTPVGEQVWNFRDINTRAAVETAPKTPELTQHPGVAKSARLQTLKHVVGREPATTPPELIQRAQDEIATLEADDDVIEYEARKKAEEKNLIKELTTKAKAPAETAEERKRRTELAVDYETAAERSALAIAKAKASDYRSMSKRKLPPEGIEASMAAADAEVAKLQTALDLKTSELGARWDQALRADPNAFLKQLEARKEELRPKELTAERLAGIRAQTEAKNAQTAKNRYLEEEFADLIGQAPTSSNQAATPASQQPGISANDAAWRGLQEQFDANVGQDVIRTAVAQAVDSKGQIDSSKVEDVLLRAYTDPQGRKYPNADQGSIGQVPRPWYATNDVSLKQFIAERAKDLIRNYNQSTGEISRKVLEANPGFRLSVRKTP